MSDTHSTLGRRSLLSVLAVLVLALTAAFTGTPAAQAAGAGADTAPDQVRVLPAAPQGATAAPSAAAASPSTSPYARSIHGSPGEAYTCDSGNLCTEVWDPTVGKWEIFFFYYCNRYGLSQWLGSGYAYNNQTGGATAHFYDRNGNVIRSIPADRTKYGQDWNPVWSIRNC